MPKTRQEAVVISGKKLARQIRDEARADVEKWVSAGHRRPHLSVILVGDNPASHSYVLNKTRAAADVGKGNRKKSQFLTLICVNRLVLCCVNVSQLLQQMLCCCCFLVICFFKKSFHTWTSHRNIERNHPQALRHQWGGVVGFDRQTQHRPSCRRPAGSAAFAR